MITEYASEACANYTLLEQVAYKGNAKKFNAEFSKLGGACRKICPEPLQKKMYIKAITPVPFRNMLAGVSKLMTLKQLMNHAVEMEPLYRHSEQHTSHHGHTTNRLYNPNRAKCRNCSRWHAKTEKCRSF